MPSLGLKLRLSNITSLIASVYTTGLQMWHKFTATTWTGSNRLPDSSPIGTNTAALYTGRGLSFDGVNDVVTIGDTGVTVKTVVFYAYPDSTTTAFMQLQSTGAVRIEISSGTLSATGFTTPTLYVNGAASSTVAATTWQQIAVTSATGVSASNVLLGQSNTTYYGGDLSNVKMFSVQLSAGQIAELYANPEQALPTGVSASELVGWWQLASSIDYSIDATSGRKHGVISGATNIFQITSPLKQISLESLNKMMWFDGVNDNISFSGVTGINGTSNVTVLCFLRKLSTGGDYVFSFPNTTAGINGLDLYIAFNSVTFHAKTVSTLLTATKSGTINTFQSIMVAGTYDGANAIAYLNNSSGTPVSGTGNLNLNASNQMFIGDFSNGGWSDAFNGIVEVFAIYNKALSSAELLEIYNGGNGFDLRTNSGNYVSAANLKGYYLNKGINNVDWVDLSSSGNNGTVNGSPILGIFTKGVNNEDIIGNSIYNNNSNNFIGNGSEYALIPDAATLDITTNITLEAWIKPFTVSSNQTVIGKNNAYALNVTSGAKLQFSRWSSTVNGTVSSSTSLVINTWYHVAATYDGTTTVIYINGAQDTSSGAITGSIDATATDVLMGALTSSTNLFSGYLDSVKVYNQVLTAAQILGNYNAEKSSYQ